MAEKNLMFVGLFDCYASLLSEKQADVIEMYYCEDLSLSEISEHIGITRQGVRDIIKHAEEELLRLENGIHLYEKISSHSSLIENIREKAKQQNFSVVSDLCDKALLLFEN